MPSSDPESSNSTRRRPQFTTTHWSVVVAAGRNHSTHAKAALENLCQTYWYPLYAFVRRHGRSPHDAQDLVQSFFAACIAKNYLAGASREKGRFRSFLLLALKRFLANEWDKARAQKRGGPHASLSLDSLTSEERYALEPAEHLTPDKLFDRRWALTVLETVLKRLREEQLHAGRIGAFEQLKDCLTSGGRGTPYAELAARLGVSEGSVKVSVHRLRQRYRALLTEEIANTVSSPEEIEEERRHLLAALSG